MPGIIGCTKNVASPKEVLLARSSIKYHSYYKDDSIYQDESIICTRTHLNNIGEKKSPKFLHNAYCWVEGEMYNIKELQGLFSLNINTEAELILQAFHTNRLQEVLSKIDGHFIAVLYDQRHQEIHFISSRFGFKPLYIWQEGDYLGWSSELKSFLYFNSFPKTIDKDALNCLLDTGQFLGSATWFSNVQQVEASSWLSYSLKNSKLLKKIRYWSWSKIRALNIPFKQAANEVSILWREAIKRQCKNEDQKFMVSLSGGMDSRAIFAAFPREHELGAITFGVKQSDDIKIAQKTSAIRGSRHALSYLNKKNWLNQRLEGIWRSEGLMSFINLHATQFLPSYRDIGKISFNGFSGEVTLGSYWLKNLNNRISTERAEKQFGRHYLFDDPNDSFYDISKEIPYYLNTRVRKFTAQGLNEIKEFESRIPFFDNPLMEYVLGLPDEYRQDHRLYHGMLLNEYPAYFNSIPWQATGYPISKGKWKLYFSNRTIKILIHKIFGIDLISFAKYDKWIKEDKKIFRNILQSKDAIFPDFIHDDLKTELDSFSNTRKIAEIFTIEIWLQQIFNNKFLFTKELEEFEK